MQTIVCWLTLPVLVLAFDGAALALLARGANPAWLLPLLLAAIAFVFLAERIAPYQSDWNRSHGDRGRDTAHAIVNEAINAVSVASIPLLASLGFGARDVWPHHWPFVLQVIASLLVLDLGITFAHFASHRWAWLWRFHAVHHSVERLYGLNGLMKHPVHQVIEMSAGTAPLLLVGLPVEVGFGLAFCAATQLLAQHANVDLRVGVLRPVLAVATLHRFHHRADPRLGDVNFGLFTTLGDRLLGTAYDEPERSAALRSDELGIADAPDYPVHYLEQLAAPFRS